MLATSVVDALNPWAIFLSSAVVLWLFIWGGIKVWHKQASKTLEAKLTPFFDEIRERMNAQDLVLEEVKHEVTFNNGGSLKDGVKTLSGKVGEIMDTLTTAPATALEPLPRLGIVDTQRAQGSAIAEIRELLDNLKRKGVIA